MYLKELEIGSVKLDNNILLAPMAGVTDLPFRMICKKYGNPGLVCTEMASSRAIFYEDEKTKKLLNTKGERKPISIQIFGNDPDIMAKAATVVAKTADIIDINMGCPAPKVVKNGDGSKLLLDLDLVGEIVKSVVENVNNRPVTVKMRIGWDEENIVASDAAKIIEKAGASAIIVHGRTRQQYYSGTVDLEIIKQVKKAINIPVIGNGDIKTPKDAMNMFERTNVDGIMVGRAILGNPWFLKDIANYLELSDKETFKQYIPSHEERLNVIKEHLELLIAEKGEYIAIREMRKHICWYIKKLKDSSRIRDSINKLESKVEVIDCLEEYFKTL